MWINADSRLTYNSKDFGINNLEVTLQGEAYFEVKQNARLPFIVHLKQVDIKVLGTAFNVKDCDEEGNIEATLLNRKIAVSFKHKKKLFGNQMRKL